MTAATQSNPADAVGGFPRGPRARFPGDLLLRFRRQPLQFLTSLAREYGDIVGFKIGRQKFLFLNHPDLLKEVLVSEAHRFTKGPALQRAKATLGDGLLTSEGEKHRQQRRLAQPAFHAPRVADYAEEMVDLALNRCERWSDGQAIDAHEQMMQLTLSIVGQTLFGADVVDQVEQIGRAMTINVEMFSRALLPWGPLLNLLPLPSNRRYLKARDLLFGTIQAMVEKRRGDRGQRNDFLSLLIRAHDAEGDGGGMSDEELRDQAITIFTAGHETTANALTFTWYLLAQHPIVRERMEQELASVLNGRSPTADDVARLTYTRAVLAEAMRLYPPVWVIGRRAILPWRVGGYEVPVGTVVLMSQWVMHRDERYWHDPLKFDPGRWEEKSERPRYAYFPFSFGPRNCIGEPFAWLEGILLIATIAQRWRMELIGDGEIALRPTITLRPRGEVRMLVRSR